MANPHAGEQGSAGGNMRQGEWSEPTPAHVVGSCFVTQYYNVLHSNTGMVQHFYTDASKLIRAETGPSGAIEFASTQKDIHEKIMSFKYTDLQAEILTVDSQHSLNGGVLVMVTGVQATKLGGGRKFVQSFFLAPQENGYYVLNDIFRYIEDGTAVSPVPLRATGTGLTGLPVPVAPGVSVPVESEVYEPAPAEPAVVQNAVAAPEVETFSAAVSPLGNGVVEAAEPEEPELPAPAPAIEPVVDVVEDAVPVLEVSAVAVLDELPKENSKITYASIVQRLKAAAAAAPPPTSSDKPRTSFPEPSPTAAPPTAAPPTAAPPTVASPVVVAAPPAVLAAAAPAPPPAAAVAVTAVPVVTAPPPAAAPPTASQDAGDDAPPEMTEQDTRSIFVKNLHVQITQEELETHFNQFGAVKFANIKNQKTGLQGSCYAFIEFADQAAVQAAIEASPLFIGGRPAHIEKKMPLPNRAGRGRGGPGRSGERSYRADGVRGRGAYSSGRGGSGGRGGGLGERAGRGSGPAGGRSIGGAGSGFNGPQTDGARKPAGEGPTGERGGGSRGPRRGGGGGGNHVAKSGPGGGNAAHASAAGGETGAANGASA